jgi:hypothetical protein
MPPAGIPAWHFGLGSLGCGKRDHSCPQGKLSRGRGSRDGSCYGVPMVPAGSPFFFRRTKAILDRANPHVRRVAFSR